MHTKLTIAILIQAIYVLVLPCALRAENRSYDLVVYGATSGGIAAAVAAHREGLKVALVDAHDHIGGMMTAGLAAADLCRHSTLGGFARAIFEALGTHYGERFALTLSHMLLPSFFRKFLKAQG
jgi:phytoene dehydrogenase-like protein